MLTILTEKPSAARNFARALDGLTGEYMGEEYRIVHSVGHIFGLAKPEFQVADDLVDKYRSWDIKYLPWNPDDIHWRRAKLPNTDKILSPIRKSLKDSNEVVIATDDDPSGEGELLAWEILEYIGWKGRVTRMYFTDETPASIRKAFSRRKIILSQGTDGDYVKAWARTRFDFLSMQHTRISTQLAREKGHNMLIRQGRLKSVIVYLTGTQLDAYNNYEKKMFYEARYKDENGHIYSRRDPEGFRYDSPDMVDLGPLRPSDVVIDKTERKRAAPGKLLDLAALSSILTGYEIKPSEVLSVYQNMYEDHVVSYPRTEDKTVTTEQFKELLPHIDSIADVVGVDRSLLTHRRPRATHVKDKGSHGANRPGINVPDSLEDIEERYGRTGRLIYDILARNYLAMFGEDYQYDKQTGHIKDHPEFIGTSHLPVAKGFKAIFDNSAEKDDNENKGIPLGKRADSFVFEGCNKRPPRPTVKWLVNKLEKYNVGTGATRTSTIAEVTKADMEGSRPCQLIKEEKGLLTLTKIGIVSYNLLKGTQIADVKVTEDLFSQMDDVGDFKIHPEEILQSATRMVVNDLAIMKRNAMHMEEAKKTEKVEGYFQKDGIKVIFNRIWAGHRFTDDEVESLLAGDEITFSGKYDSGRDYAVKGILQKQTYKGRAYYGFMKTGSPDKVSGVFIPEGKTIEFRKKWGAYSFNEDDIQKLLAGETITICYHDDDKDESRDIPGCLKEKEFKGHKYWGFEPIEQERKDVVKGLFKGMKSISFKRTWGAYEFTDDDIERLLAGETITIMYPEKDGNKREVKGFLKEKTFKKRKYWGFQSLKDTRPDMVTGKYKGKKEISFKNSWNGHVFTQDEIDILLQGGNISFETSFKHGSERYITGYLKEKKYEGHKYWGFEPEFF